MRVRFVWSMLAPVVLLAGCATSTSEGRAALTRGSYTEAAQHFEEALAREPGRVGDLTGLGVARYKLGALDEAQRALAEAVGLAPDARTAHLYLALIAIRRGEAAVADEHLTRYLALGAPARLAAELERARRVLREPTTPELREYMAASLEDAYQWAGEVASALAAAYDAEMRWTSIYLLPRYYRCW